MKKDGVLFPGNKIPTKNDQGELKGWQEGWHSSRACATAATSPRKFFKFQRGAAGNSLREVSVRLRQGKRAGKFMSLLKRK